MSAARMNDAGAQLARALLSRAQAFGQEVAIGPVRTRPWASATFEGERVEIDLPRVEFGAPWLADLAEIELHVRRHLVADLSIRSAVGAPTTVEALLIRAA